MPRENGVPFLTPGALRTAGVAAPRSRGRDIAWVVALALAVRLSLIGAFPMIFGDDTMVRLVNHDKVLMSYQLPLLQAFIYLLSQLSGDPLLVRLFMSAIGAIACAGFYLLAEDLTNRDAALWASLLFCVNPFIAGLSTVPYQEILMLAGLLFAFHFFFRENWNAASLFLGLACLTRFEAWVACTVLMLAFALREPRRWSAFLKAASLFGWAPLAWILFRHGLSPSGSFVLDHSVSIARLARISYIGWITATHLPIPVLLLACAGVVILLQGQSWRDRRLQILAAFVALFFVAVLFSAHGEPPDPERHVTMREAHIPIAAISLLAVFALVRRSRLGSSLVALGIALGGVGCYRFVHTYTSRPDIQLGYQAAKYLDAHTAANERVLVLANPLREADLQLYLDKVRKTGGEAGLQEARRILSQMDPSPLDYQRILIHSRLGRSRLRPSTDPGPAADWIAAWSNFNPQDARAARWYQSATTNPTTILRYGDRSISILHIH